jgi:hypothetical protein
MTCEHQYLVTHWKKTEYLRTAQEIMCPKCLDILDMDDIIQAKGKKAKDKRANRADISSES